MDSTKTIYSSFPFECTVKSTSYQIQYRKAENINEIDEIFCSIINAKGNQIEFSELENLLGFNLQDLAETDIFNIYLKSISDYKLISIIQEIIHLTEFGQEALQTKLKYKYFFVSTELFENQTVKGESFDFSFKTTFDLDNRLSHEREIKIQTLDNPELKQKLQFQLFENDIYKGEIIELYESNPQISYKEITLYCKTFELNNTFQLSVCKSDGNKTDIQFLIELTENEEFKSKLIRKGMYHHVLAENSSITAQDIEVYKDLWKWKELAENPKIDWNDKKVFKLFLEKGDGSIWSIISEKAPIESIKSVIAEYAEYWNWTTLTERLDNDFIKEQIENYNWDFEELSHKETELIESLLSKLTLKDRDWGWNYLSKNLPDKFIEEHIEDFAWDFYEITVSKNEVFKNTFIKYRDNLETLISKDWNWKFISQEINLNFLLNNISALASKLDWNTVLFRFLNNEEITAKYLKDEPFKSLLKQHLPDDFIIAHQKYLWTLKLIDFFEEQNLIQWETKTYIQGFDTNENIVWNKQVFGKYHNRITTEKGFLNVSQHISDYSLIEQFPDFAWDWTGVSTNNNLNTNAEFITKAFTGKLQFSKYLLWNEILNSITKIQFLNNYLDTFYNNTIDTKQIEFWKSLTKKESQEYIFANLHFPWDWTFITENTEEEAILDSFDNEVLLKKWDWKIASQKIDKNVIIDNIEVLTPFLDWIYIINSVFNDEIVFDNIKLRIVHRLSLLDAEKRKEAWEVLTSKYPFDKVYDYVKKTYEFPIWEWDWDYISGYAHLPVDIVTVNKFKHLLNWNLFTEKRKFEYKKEEWNYKEYLRYTLKYLKIFQDYWNWNRLTQNSNLNYNREFIEIFNEKWDWQYLSEYGGFLIQKKKDKENYLLELISEFPKIKFEILSKRNDIYIGSSLILSTKDKNWDWQILSENEKVEISNELILELKDKNWNWKALSKRKAIVFTNETFLQLLEKDWDWSYLSENKNLEFSVGFIEKANDKSWNWKAVSRHKTFFPTVEILTLTKDFDLDWESLSKHSSLNPTKEILSKFENQWHWQSITENPKINFLDIEFIERFSDKWNWHFICKSGKLTLNNQILNKFKEYLEWNLISSNTNIDFTKEIIQEFKQYWNWRALKENKRVEELLGSYVYDEIAKSTSLNFIDKIEQQESEWKGSIYHFSHIDNAVEIIKNRKIQSRNKAPIKGDAAGNVVHLRNDAHDYARFYFRPHTPTQFYNEFLGKNLNDGYETKKVIFDSYQTGPIYERVSYYEKARGLGFPKCPIPIFFKFSLKEVLFKHEKRCCISNGNMQTGSTQFGSVDKMTNKFGFEDLYYTPQQYAKKEDWNKYRNYAQQEFLVKDELSFDDLSDFEIVCPSETDRSLLISLLGQQHKDVFAKIVVDKSYYNNENPRVSIEEEETELHISTTFRGIGYFVLSGANITDIEILSGDIKKMDKDKIIFGSYVSLGNINQNIKLNFVDESERNWFIYEKALLEKTKNIATVWQEIDATWKSEIYLNYLLSKLTFESYLNCLCDDSYGLDYLFYFHFINNSDVVDENYLKTVDKVLQSGIKKLSEDDITIIFASLKVLSVGGVSNLLPLPYFQNLEVLIIGGSTISDFQSLKHSTLNHIYEHSIYSNNKIDFSKLQNEFPHIKINLLELDDLYTLYYKEFGVIFNNRWGISEYNIEGLLSHLEKTSKILNQFLNTKVRHYVLKEHCFLVCTNFSRYGWNLPNEIDKNLFMVFLCLHDIGKPQAFNEGNKNNQYQYSRKIITEIWDTLPFSGDDLSIILSLLDGDYLGEYFQCQLSLKEIKEKLFKLAEYCDLNINTFFKVYMIYYQCDIASYTADAGGIKFLEHLFEYQYSSKVFDEDEGLLKMSPKYWEMYKKLKEEIQNGN